MKKKKTEMGTALGLAKAIYGDKAVIREVLSAPHGAERIRREGIAHRLRDDLHELRIDIKAKESATSRLLSIAAKFSKGDCSLGEFQAAVANFEAYETLIARSKAVRAELNELDLHVYRFAVAVPSLYHTTIYHSADTLSDLIDALKAERRRRDRMEETP